MKYFEKIAFNMEDADRILQVFKRVQVPKGLANKNKLMSHMRLGGISKDVRGVAKLHDMPVKQLSESMTSSGIKRGTVFQTGKGDFLKSIKDIKNSMMLPVKKDIKLSSADRKMTNAIFKGHEIDEIKVKPSKAFSMFGHNSPDVILREHNKVTTLPKEFKKVKKLSTRLRNESEEAPFLNEIFPNFKYGKSPRLSRHARKKMVHSIEKEMGDV